MEVIFLSLLIILSGCSTPSKKVEPGQLKTFVDQWKLDYEPEPAYAERYETYLKSVEKLYQKENLETNFALYLSTLNNMNQLMGHAEYNMPYKFKKERGRYANPNLKEYKDYLESNLNYTQRKLGNERKVKIRLDVGAEFYSKLQKNHETGLEFPL